MSNTPQQPDSWQHPIVRNYWLLCLGALLTLTLALAFRNVGVWSLLPILVGSLSLAGRWRSGPLAVLLALGWVLYSERLGLSPLELLERVSLAVLFLVFGGRPQYGYSRMTFGVGGRFLLSDLILVAGTLAYCAAHYRLVSLVSLIFPVDRRPQPFRRDGKPDPGPGHRRSEQTVTPREIVLLLATVPAWVVLAAAVWSWLAGSRPPVLEWPSSFWQKVYPELVEDGGRVFIELPPVLWRAMLLVWVLGVGMIVVAGMVGYLARRRMTAQEAALYLQDVTWRETCREQRRLNHWLTWARRRRGRERS